MLPPDRAADRDVGALGDDVPSPPMTMKAPSDAPAAPAKSGSASSIASSMGSSSEKFIRSSSFTRARKFARGETMTFQDAQAIVDSSQKIPKSVRFAAAAQILSNHLPGKPDKQVELPTPPKMPENMLRNAGVKDIGPIPERLAIKKIDIEEEKRQMEEMQKKLKEAEIKMKKKMEELKAKKIEEEKQRKIQAEKDAKAARAKLAEEQFGAFQISAPAVSNVAQPAVVESEDESPPATNNPGVNAKVSALRRTFMRSVSKKRMSSSFKDATVPPAPSPQIPSSSTSPPASKTTAVNSATAAAPSNSSPVLLDEEIPTDASQWEVPKTKDPLKFLSTTARASLVGLNNLRPKPIDRTAAAQATNSSHNSSPGGGSIFSKMSARTSLPSNASAPNASAPVRNLDGPAARVRSIFASRKSRGPQHQRRSILSSLRGRSVNSSTDNLPALTLSTANVSSAQQAASVNNVAASDVEMNLPETALPGSADPKVVVLKSAEDDRPVEPVSSKSPELMQRENSELAELVKGVPKQSAETAKAPKAVASKWTETQKAPTAVTSKSVEIKPLAQSKSFIARAVASKSLKSTMGTKSGEAVKDAFVKSESIKKEPKKPVEEATNTTTESVERTPEDASQAAETANVESKKMKSVESKKVASKAVEANAVTEAAVQSKNAEPEGSRSTKEMKPAASKPVISRSFRKPVSTGANKQRAVASKSLKGNSTTIADVTKPVTSKSAAAGLKRVKGIKSGKVKEPAVQKSVSVPEASDVKVSPEAKPEAQKVLVKKSASVSAAAITQSETKAETKKVGEATVEKSATLTSIVTEKKAGAVFDMKVDAKPLIVSKDLPAPGVKAASATKDVSKPKKTRVIPKAPEMTPPAKRSVSSKVVPKNSEVKSENSEPVAIPKAEAAVDTVHITEPSTPAPSTKIKKPAVPKPQVVPKAPERKPVPKKELVLMEDIPKVTEMTADKKRSAAQVQPDVNKPVVSKETAEVKKPVTSKLLNEVAESIKPEESVPKNLILKPVATEVKKTPKRPTVDGDDEKIDRKMTSVQQAKLFWENGGKFADEPTAVKDTKSLPKPTRNISAIVATTSRSKSSKEVNESEAMKVVASPKNELKKTADVPKTTAPKSAEEVKKAALQAVESSVVELKKSGEKAGETKAGISAHLEGLEKPIPEAVEKKNVESMEAATVTLEAKVSSSTATVAKSAGDVKKAALQAVEPKIVEFNRASSKDVERKMDTSEDVKKSGSKAFEPKVIETRKVTSPAVEAKSIESKKSDDPMDIVSEANSVVPDVKSVVPEAKSTVPEAKTTVPEEKVNETNVAAKAITEEAVLNGNIPSKKFIPKTKLAPVVFSEPKVEVKKDPKTVVPKKLPTAKDALNKVVSEAAALPKKAEVASKDLVTEATAAPKSKDVVKKTAVKATGISKTVPKLPKFEDALKPVDKMTLLKAAKVAPNVDSMKKPVSDMISADVETSAKATSLSSEFNKDLPAISAVSKPKEAIEDRSAVLVENVEEMGSKTELGEIVSNAKIPVDNVQARKGSFVQAANVSKPVPVIVGSVGPTPTDDDDTFVEILVPVSEVESDKRYMSQGNGMGSSRLDFSGLSVEKNSLGFSGIVGANIAPKNEGDLAKAKESNKVSGILEEAPRAKRMLLGKFRMSKRNIAGETPRIAVNNNVESETEDEPKPRRSILGFSPANAREREDGPVSMRKMLNGRKIRSSKPTPVASDLTSATLPDRADPSSKGGISNQVSEAGKSDGAPNAAHPGGMMKWGRKIQLRAKRMHTNPELARGDEAEVRNSINSLPRAASGSHILDGLSDTGNLRRTSSAMPPKSSGNVLKEDVGRTRSAAPAQHTGGAGGRLLRKSKKRGNGGGNENRAGFGLGARMRKLGGNRGRMSRQRSRNSLAIDEELAERERKLQAAERQKREAEEREEEEKRAWNMRYENLKESKKNYVDQVENEIRRMESEIGDRMALPEDWQVLPRTHEGRKVRMPGSEMETHVSKLPTEAAVRQDREDRPGSSRTMKRSGTSLKSLFSSSGTNEAQSGDVTVH